jgi:formylglycine-generating enzyme
MIREAITGEKSLGMEKPSEMVSGIRPEWDDWVRKAVANDMDRRFQTAREMKDALSFKDATVAPVPQVKPQEPIRQVPEARPSPVSREVDFSSGSTYQAEENLRETFTIRDLGLIMLWVKPGTFMMGSPSSEAYRHDNEVQHQVTLTEGFYLGKHEVTQGQWEQVMGSNPSYFKGADRPVENVSWNDAVEFCKKLTERERLAGRLPAGMAYQLPTEAQWEYACRAGTTTTFSFGENLTSRQANIRGGPGETSPVGKYPANALGVHDMHGNVCEWCSDWYGSSPNGAVRDPTGPADGSLRVGRGGSWFGTANLARCADRYGFVPANSNSSLGFRLSLRTVSK